jgi:hypothetical protein
VPHDLVRHGRVISAEDARWFEGIQNVEVPDFNARTKGSNGTKISGVTGRANVSVAQAQRKGWEGNVVVDKEVSRILFVHVNLQRSKLLTTHKQTSKGNPIYTQLEHT